MVLGGYVCAGRGKDVVVNRVYGFVNDGVGLSVEVKGSVGEEGFLEALPVSGAVVRVG